MGTLVTIHPFNCACCCVGDASGTGRAVCTDATLV